MVDYSKFNNIEGASDSDDEKQTVDPDKAEAWLRKYDELAKDQSSDSDSDIVMSRRSPASTGRRRAPRASGPTSTTPLYENAMRSSRTRSPATPRG